MRSIVRTFAVASAAALLAACVTNIHPTVSSNPPPAKPLKEFEAFEVRPIAKDPTVGEPAAVAKIQQNLDLRLGALVGSWTKGDGDTLVIEPRLHELKFVGGGARFLAGAMAGSSAVRMTLRLTDKATGQVIAEPEFYQRAAAYGGAYSFGGTDNGMLVRITTVVDEYLRRNYERAVGGPTGLEASQP